MRASCVSILVLTLCGAALAGCDDDDDGPSQSKGGTSAGDGGSGAAPSAGTPGEGGGGSNAGAGGQGDGGANAGAGGEGAGGEGAGGPYEAHGVVQKGPFNIGSTMTMQELDASLEATGRTFSAKTSDNFGSFEVPGALLSPFLEVIADGYYYDEVAGASSSSPLTLRSYSDLRTNQIANVNVLTDLAGPRLAHLIGEGAGFAAADAQARAEVLQVFNIQEETGSFDDMDVALAGDDNAILLAASAVMQQMATSQASGSATVVSELSERLADIASDLASDGVLSDAGLKQDLLDAGVALDLAEVRSNLEARFDELGSGTVPAFEDYVDSDADGLLNMHDYSLAFATKSTIELATEVISEELEVHLFDGGTEMATASRGTIVLNGTDTGDSAVPVQDGDTLAIKLVSADEYVDLLSSVTSNVVIGKNSGSFTLETRFGPKSTLYRHVPGDHLGLPVAFAGSDVLGLGKVPAPSQNPGDGTLLRFSGADGSLELEGAPYFGKTFKGPIVWTDGQVLVGTFNNGGASSDVHLLDATTGALIRTFPDPAPRPIPSYGRAYAANADVVAVSDTNGGKVYLFDRAQGTLLRTIFADPTNVHGAFGDSLVISGDELLIADVSQTDNRRSLVEIHGLDGALRRSLVDPLPPSEISCFGCSLAVGGGYILVGAPHFTTNGSSKSGAVHIFDAVTGARVRTLENPLPQELAFFGQELSVDGDALLIGAFGQDSGGVANAGSAFLFDLDTGRIRYMYPNPAPKADARFEYGGFAIGGGKIAIGSQKASPGGFAEAGAIYIFDAAHGLLLP